MSTSTRISLSDVPLLMELIDSVDWRKKFSDNRKAAMEDIAKKTGKHFSVNCIQRFACKMNKPLDRVRGTHASNRVERLAAALLSIVDSLRKDGFNCSDADYHAIKAIATRKRDTNKENGTNE